MEAPQPMFNDEFSEKVFVEYKDVIFHTVSRMLDYRRDAAEDIAYGVLHKLYDRFKNGVGLWDKFKADPESVRTSYIKSAAKNAAIDHIRKWKLEEKLKGEEREMSRSQTAEGPRRPLWPQEEALYRRDVKDHVLNACRVLTGLQKEFVWLKIEYPGISNGEIAERLKVSEKDIRHTIFPQIKENIERCSLLGKYFVSQNGARHFHEREE